MSLITHHHIRSWAKQRDHWLYHNKMYQRVSLILWIAPESKTCTFCKEWNHNAVLEGIRLKISVYLKLCCRFSMLHLNFIYDQTLNFSILGRILRTDSLHHTKYLLCAPPLLIKLFNIAQGLTVVQKFAIPLTNQNYILGGFSTGMIWLACWRVIET